MKHENKKYDENFSEVGFLIVQEDTWDNGFDRMGSL